MKEKNLENENIKKSKPILKSMKLFGKALAEGLETFFLWFVPDHKCSLALGAISAGLMIGAGFVANPLAVTIIGAIAGQCLFGACRIAVAEHLYVSEIKDERKQRYEDLKRTTELESRECEEVSRCCEENEFTASNS